MLIFLNDLLGFQVHSICFIVWMFENMENGIIFFKSPSHLRVDS